MPAVATITYTGTRLVQTGGGGGVITTSPWSAWGCMFPDSGSPCDNPQFQQEVMQPDGLDGARYRTGGMHYPQFRMVTSVPASKFSDAKKIAREHEMCKGEQITIDFGGTDTGAQANPQVTKSTYQVINVKAMPTAKQIVGATQQSSGNDGNIPGGGAAPVVATTASVDTEWTLQKILA